MKGEGLKEELTAKMHAEFTIDEDTEIRNKALSVWTLLNKESSEQEIRERASSFGISFEDAMKRKEYYFRLRENK